MELQVIEIPEFLPLTKQSGIEKAQTYAATFAPFMITVKELSTKAATINKENPTLLDAKLAREVRLALVKNRTATGTQKDKDKAAILAESNLIQNLHNVVVNTSQLVEAELMEVEKFAERQEAARVSALKAERMELLLPYVEDANVFPLGTISEDAFNDLLTGSKLAHEAKIEAARLAEEKRIVEEKERLAEQARIKAENERLKLEAEEKEKSLAAERAETARLAKIEADKNAEKLAKIEAANKAARDKAAAELKAANDAAAKYAADLKAKQDAEAKVLADKIAAEKKAAKAPVKEKMRIAVSSLALVLPDSEITSDILSKFNGFKKWALDQIEST